MKYLALLLVLISVITNSDEAVDCEKVLTTLEINHCMYKDLVKAESTMEKYFLASLEVYTEDSVSVDSIKIGQEAWLKYREAHCASVYDTWRGGTIRTAQALACKLELTHQRTITLWQAFLTYSDSTPPLLPKPKPYKPEPH